MSTRSLPFAFSLALLLAACSGSDAPSSTGPAGPTNDATPEVATSAHPAHYATTVVSFTQGDGGGYGKDQLPTIIAGPPHGGGCCYGSTDVLSLGNGGEVVVGFDVEIVDGDGPDFLVFENAFEIANDPTNVFAELGEVSVSEDGASWTTFPCDATLTKPPYGTCAGWHPVYATPDDPVDVTMPDKAGGDPFDLAAIGVKKAKYVRIRDMRSNRPAANGMAGFDLDAIAVLHW
jgi:hypothetical protein